MQLGDIITLYREDPVICCTSFNYNHEGVDRVHVFIVSGINSAMSVFIVRETKKGFSIEKESNIPFISNPVIHLDSYYLASAKPAGQFPQIVTARITTCDSIGLLQQYNFEISSTDRHSFDFNYELLWTSQIPKWEILDDITRQNYFIHTANDLEESRITAGYGTGIYTLRYAGVEVTIDIGKLLTARSSDEIIRKKRLVENYNSGTSQDNLEVLTWLPTRYDILREFKELSLPILLGDPEVRNMLQLSSSKAGVSFSLFVRAEGFMRDAYEQIVKRIEERVANAVTDSERAADDVRGAATNVKEANRQGKVQKSNYWSLRVSEEKTGCNGDEEDGR